MNIYKGKYKYSVQSEYDEEVATSTLTEARREAIRLSKALSSPIYIYKMTNGEGDKFISEYLDGVKVK